MRVNLGVRAVDKAGKREWWREMASHRWAHGGTRDPTLSITACDSYPSVAKLNCKNSCSHARGP